MTPVELKQYFDQNPPPSEFELYPWAKFTDTQKFLHSAFMELSNIKGDYNKCPSYWRLKELHKALTKKPDQANSEN